MIGFFVAYLVGAGAGAAIKAPRRRRRLPYSRWSDLRRR